ncbi:hypothetical protein TWF281_011340 [Arthrobotrys megalospora]
MSLLALPNEILGPILDLAISSSIEEPRKRWFDTSIYDKIVDLYFTCRRFAALVESGGHLHSRFQVVLHTHLAHHSGAEGLTDAYMPRNIDVAMARKCPRGVREFRLTYQKPLYIPNVAHQTGSDWPGLRIQDYLIHRISKFRHLTTASLQLYMGPSSPDYQNCLSLVTNVLCRLLTSSLSLKSLSLGLEFGQQKRELWTTYNGTRSTYAELERAALTDLTIGLTGDGYTYTMEADNSWLINILLSMFGDSLTSLDTLNLWFPRFERVDTTVVLKSPNVTPPIEDSWKLPQLRSLSVTTPTLCRLFKRLESLQFDPGTAHELSIRLTDFVHQPQRDHSTSETSNPNQKTASLLGQMTSFFARFPRLKLLTIGGATVLDLEVMTTILLNRSALELSRLKELRLGSFGVGQTQRSRYRCEKTEIEELEAAWDQLERALRSYKLQYTRKPGEYETTLDISIVF